MPTLQETLRNAARELRDISSTPQLDAEVLLAHVCQIRRIDCISRGLEELESEHYRQFQELISRRLKHEPVAYLVGQQEFFGRPFSVDSRVLIPRPETELLVERAIEILRKGGAGQRVLDLGTGSGCIAITLALECSGVMVDAVDVSPEALEVARHNAQSLSCTNVTFIESNWFSQVDFSDYDLLVSNPPYVIRGDTQCGPEIAFEPELALYAEEDGTQALKFLYEQAPKYLRSGGTLLCEIGSDQGEISMKLAREVLGGVRQDMHYDLANLPRCQEILCSDVADS